MNRNALVNPAASTASCVIRAHAEELRLGVARAAEQPVQHREYVQQRQVHEGLFLLRTEVVRVVRADREAPHHFGQELEQPLHAGGVRLDLHVDVDQVQSEVEREGMHESAVGLVFVGRVGEEREEGQAGDQHREDREGWHLHEHVLAGQVLLHLLIATEVFVRLILQQLALFWRQSTDLRLEVAAGRLAQ